MLQLALGLAAIVDEARPRTQGRNGRRASRWRGSARTSRRPARRGSTRRRSATIAPARSTCGGAVVRSTIVLSTPTGRGPPSSTRRARGSRTPPRSSSTWRAVVGLTAPEAVGRRRRQPVRVRSSSSSVSGWAGAEADRLAAARHAVDHVPSRAAPASSVVPASSVARRATAAVAGSRRRPTRSMSPTAMWTISGWPTGRPLTSKMRATAAGCGRRRRARTRSRSGWPRGRRREAPRPRHDVGGQQVSCGTASMNSARRR